MGRNEAHSSYFSLFVSCFLQHKFLCFKIGFLRGPFPLICGILFYTFLQMLSLFIYFPRLVASFQGCLYLTQEMKPPIYIFQGCTPRKNDTFVAKIVNTRLTKIFMAIFALDERLPSSATLELFFTSSKQCTWGGRCCQVRLQQAGL